MYIRKLTIENFKGFEGNHVFDFDKNLVFFVGDNNCGKSTTFESIEFLRSGLPANKSVGDITNKKTKGQVSVIAELHENIKSVINDFSETKYLKYVFEEDGVEKLIIKRSSEEKTIKQDGKDRNLNIKTITLWNSETKQFENPAGIDTVFRTLFESQFIWADTNPEDITDFGATKICGRLLSSTIGNFFDTSQWKKFKEIFDETFATGDDNFSKRTELLGKKITDIINSQYGQADVSFKFELPDASSFIKTGCIDIDDGSGVTSSKDKGTGMQRALALALIQIYADLLTKHPEDPEKLKPLFLFVDEPETFLHPYAQEKLLNALMVISVNRQIFVCTHSPYLLRSFNKNNHILYVFRKNDTSNSAQPSKDLDLFQASSPTWGEINYFAFGLLSPEFHNELYGFLQARAIDENGQNEKCDLFDKYLDAHGIQSDLDWIHEKPSGDIKYKVPLQTYIRNSIHHPENTKNIPYTHEQLGQSIEKLIEILRVK
ncbi:MAG: AAA family ATPase [Candidatus Daviesbacteria bacterium]|nr:AAA family ATPase [Candidatus Daviesbacteria bacterium]